MNVCALKSSVIIDGVMYPKGTVALQVVSPTTVYFKLPNAADSDNSRLTKDMVFSEIIDAAFGRPFGSLAKLMAWAEANMFYTGGAIGSYIQELKLTSTASATQTNATLIGQLIVMLFVGNEPADRYDFNYNTGAITFPQALAAGQQITVIYQGQHTGYDGSTWS